MWLILMFVMLQQSGSTTLSGPITTAKVLVDGLRCHDFCVEQLSSDDLQELSAAEEKLKAAQNAYDLALFRVKARHGGAPDGSEHTPVLCWPYDSVEIRGKYALIQYNFPCGIRW